jgi:RNA polymerase sigma factor (sigma-70 family)
LTEDKELIELVLKGDAKAADLLFKRYEPRLLRASLSFLGGPSAESGDMVQDTFLVALSFLKQQGLGEPLYPWLRQICVRLCYARRRGQGPILICLDDDLERYMRTMAIERVRSEVPEVQKRQKLGLLREMIKPLDSDNRQIIQLRNVNGMTYTQVSRVLDISKENVAARLARARGQIRASAPASPDGSKKRSLSEEFGAAKRKP